MRWKAKVLGDKRIVTKFCLFPRCINNTWYWLETIKIKQECVYQMWRGYIVLDCNNTPTLEWKNIDVEE